MAEPVNAASREQVLANLKPLGTVMARPELGGTGLLLNGTLFGVLHGGLLYLKVDRRQREEYLAAGMRPLEPRPRQKLAAFLAVPPDVVADPGRLLEHAARAAGRPVPTPAPAAAAAPEAKAEAETQPKRPAKPKAKTAPDRTGSQTRARRPGSAEPRRG